LRKPESKKNQRYVNIFNDMGADWEAIVNMHDTEKEAEFIANIMPKRGIILDLCCGTGRHSIALSKRGWTVVGMDLSKSLLALAKPRMKRARIEFPLVRADMRFFPFRDNLFNGVVNMFTSFGYLPSESEDALSLLEINRTMRGRGKFLLDLANRDHIVTTFREREWADFEPFYLLEKRSLDLKSSKLASQWTLIHKNTCRIDSIQHTVRLFTVTRIEQLLNEAGFEVKEVYGGYDKQEFLIQASRMIVLAEKLA